MLVYNGYQAMVEFDAASGIWYGRVLGIRDVITFQAESEADLRRECEASVDDYLAFCKERGEAPERPRDMRGDENPG